MGVLLLSDGASVDFPRRLMAILTERRAEHSDALRAIRARYDNDWSMLDLNELDLNELEALRASIDATPKSELRLTGRTDALDGDAVMRRVHADLDMRIADLSPSNVQMGM